MNVEAWVSVASGIVGIIIAIVTFVISLSKYKKAKTEAEKNQILNDMKNQMADIVENVEITYNDISNALKASGKSASAMKLDSALVKLQAYATEHRYTFDKVYWTNEIANLIDLTKKVN